MPLAPNTKLGQYEVVGSVGAGGMGEVYRARDTKLDRDVAIKVLPEEFARDRERLDRFEREARLLAQLNHANIATLHGLEEHDGQQFLVMELVEGETLAERIAQGLLPLDEAIPLFIQIAEGLEAAHEKGIIHRDLKPANIKIGPNGKPKILDFGLAKAFVGDTEVSPDSSQSPTLTKGTALGVIMGTASYMSPEQARGKLVDRRTDVWAFGCCLYEALTGRRAFEGETVTDTLSAVLSKEPDWSRLPGWIPGSVRRLLERCLRKDVNIRIQHIGDTRIEILESSIERAPTEGQRPPWALVGAILATIITGVILRGLFAPSPVATQLPPTVRLRVTLPDGHKLVSQRGRAEVFGQYSPLAISRDGGHIAFAARDASGTARLYLRAIDSLEMHPLAGTEDGELPFFSPDGRWLGFLVGNRVLKVPVKGGVPTVFGKTPLQTARGVAWASERTIVLGGVNTGAFRMDAETGETQPLTELDSERQENYHAWPCVLPDGEHVLFTVVTPIRTDLAVLNLDTGEWRLLDQTEGAAQPHYLASGHLVFFRRGGLFAAPFDLSRLAISGTTTNVPVGELVQGWNAGLDYGFFAASASGSLACVPGTADLQESRVVRVDRHGNAEPLSEVGRFAYMPALSPDGARLVVTDSLPSEETDADLFLLDAARGSRARITPDGASVYPVWGADGERIFFGRFGEGGDSDVCSMAADGSGVMKALADLPFDQQPTDASRDGRLVAFDEIHPDTGYDVRIISLDDNPSTRAFAATSANERDASFSPDGRFVAYVSDESGRDEIYVRPLSGDGAKAIVSTAGGRWPRWSRSGDELFYMQDTFMMSVPIQLEPYFRPGTPEPLFEGNYVHQFDVFPDGEHFAMVTFPDVALREIEVVANWSTEIAKLVPTGQ